MKFRFSLTGKDLQMLEGLKNSKQALAKRYYLVLTRLFLLDDFRDFVSSERKKWKIPPTGLKKKVRKISPAIVDSIENYAAKHQLHSKMPELGAISNKIIVAICADYIFFNAATVPPSIPLGIDGHSNTVERKENEIILSFDANVTLPELKEALVKNWNNIEIARSVMKAREDLAKAEDPERVNKLDHAMSFKVEKRFSTKKHFARDLLVFEYYEWLKKNPEMVQSKAEDLQKPKYREYEVKRYLADEYDGTVLDVSTIIDIYHEIKNDKETMNKVE